MERDSSDTHELLKQKAMLLLRRERELFTFRQERTRTEAWLGVLHTLSLGLGSQRVDGVLREWAGLLIARLGFQVAGVYRFDQSCHRGLLEHGEPAAALNEGVELDTETHAFLKANPTGYHESASALRGSEPLGDKTGLADFHWAAFYVSNRGFLLVAGSLPGAAAFHPYSANDGSHFSMLSRHLHALLDNAVLLTDLEREHHQLTCSNQELERSLRELAATQHRLSQASRLAGMAEVATTVLHNVGNVLNSVNVSASLAAECARNAPLEKLVKVCNLLEQHRADLGRFLTEDPRGGLVVSYLRQLTQAEESNRHAIVQEIGALQKHVDHIKVIVAAQQSLASTGGTTEPFALDALLEDVLRISTAEYETDGIDLVREFGAVPTVTGDRHRLLQILTNLLSNARHAVRAVPGTRRVAVRTRANGNGTFTIDVEDTGCGVPTANLEKVFNYGFTTRPGGHGFGLHGSACAASEMGGRIEVHSDGPGQGTRFTIELPLRVARTREARLEPGA